jgi:dihydrofolate reductase
MRKLIVTNIMSLDGYYEGPGRNVMALPMDGAFDAYNLERMQAADIVLLGHNSYGMFSGFWPSMADNPNASPTNREFSQLYNKIGKVAVSNHLILQDTDVWRDTTRVIGGDDTYNEIARLKDQPDKEIVIFGSHTLWNNLLAHGLVDELHFIVGNVVLGGGTPIFSEPLPYNDPKHSLHLIGTRQFDGSENVLLQYEVKYKNK